MWSGASVQGARSKMRGVARPAGQRGDVDWSSYARAYDLLSEHNPEYRALMSNFAAFLETIEAPRVIYDIGGGTGNYSRIAARAFCDSEIHLVEPDAGMIGAAKAKLADHASIHYESCPFEEIDATGTADLVICVHAIYTMPSPKQRIADLRRMLRPGGWLYLVDIGRVIDVSDWRRYLFASLRKEHGLAGALRILWQGREIGKQNKAIFEAQKKGVYWTHSEAEIAADVVAAGFDIVEQKTVYRGYSDLLICRPRP